MFLMGCSCKNTNTRRLLVPVNISDLRGPKKLVGAAALWENNVACEDIRQLCPFKLFIP